MSAVPHATDGVFCDHAGLLVANGQVWDGLFCEGVQVEPPVFIPGGNKSVLEVAVRNVEARVLPQDTYNLFVTSRIYPIADAAASVCKGSYGFIMCSSQEQAVADAICSFNIGTVVCELNSPESIGYARAPDFVLEDYAAPDIAFLIGEADANADLFMLEEGRLTVNSVLHAWGIKNPTDEELVMIINTIRRRR